MSTLVFVHGWSVTDTSTYGDLPSQLQQHARSNGLALSVTQVWLSEYVSFDDTVGMADLVRGFDRALRTLPLPDASFACIAHSAGAPVVREWLRAQRERPDAYSTLRLSHLVMLAPANFGSALAQLGNGRINRFKSWFAGMEPGQQVLDWLELGSAESLSLNLDFIHGGDPAGGGQFPFVLTGDRPDRALYDQLNSYTGEDGSDGVVRIAAANLNACHAVLSPQSNRTALDADRLSLHVVRGPRCAFKLVAGAAHAGSDHGIMSAATPSTVAMIVQCLRIDSVARYAALCQQFDRENAVRDSDKVELEPAGPFAPRVHIHDPRSQLIVRLADDSGEPLKHAGFLLTAGAQASADLMPRHFMLDRQANTRCPGTVSLLLDYNLLAGDARVADPRNTRKTLRAAVTSHRPYGARVQPADLAGLVHHAVAQSLASDDLFDILAPHQTTVLDVVLPRKIHEGVFRLTRHPAQEDFHRPLPGDLIT